MIVSRLLNGILVPALFLGCTAFLASCGEEPGASRSTGNLSMLDDTLVNYNRKVIRTEDSQIEDLIARYGWKMQTTSTGLRYMITGSGKGPMIRKNQTAVIRCTVRLLNGEILYDGNKEGLREIRPGHQESERGLEEGILLMRSGDRGKFIVPSHLAFGLLGDQKRIPPGAALVYDVELVNIK